MKSSCEKSGQKFLTTGLIIAATIGSFAVTQAQAAPYSLNTYNSRAYMEYQRYVQHHQNKKMFDIGMCVGQALSAQGVTYTIGAPKDSATQAAIMKGIQTCRLAAANTAANSTGANTPGSTTSTTGTSTGTGTSTAGTSTTSGTSTTGSASAGTASSGSSGATSVGSSSGSTSTISSPTPSPTPTNSANSSTSSAGNTTAAATTSSSDVVSAILVNGF
jgi:hypothetical protein